MTITLGVVGFVAWSVAAIGMHNGYEHTVVDQEARTATYHSELSGTYSLVSTGEQLCGDDEDYLSCINQHVTLFNSVCVGYTLTDSAQLTCDDLSEFIDDVNDQYDSCGYGCRTRADGEDWGWSYQRLVQTRRDVLTSDGVPQVSHVERCDFQFAGWSIGSCPSRSTV